MERITRLSASALILGLLLAGCDAATSPDDEAVLTNRDNSYVPSTVVGDEPPENLRAGVFTVCKAAPEAPDRRFTFATEAAGSNTEDTLVPTVDLADGECAQVYAMAEESTDAVEVTVTEHVPPGWRLEGVTVQWIDEEANVTTREATEPVVTEWIGPDAGGGRASCGNAPARAGGGRGGARGGGGGGLHRLDRWPIPEETLVDEVWSVPADLQGVTLFDALRFGGGPSFEDKVRILLRAATAAYLNALTIDYDLTAEQVVDEVNAAIASGDAALVIALA